EQRADLKGRRLLVATADGGATWLPATPCATSTGVAAVDQAQLVAPAEGFMVCARRLLHTLDAGQTWQIASDFSTAPELKDQAVRSVSFADSLHGWLTDAAGR